MPACAGGEAGKGAGGAGEEAERQARAAGSSAGPNRRACGPGRPGCRLQRPRGPPLAPGARVQTAPPIGWPPRAAAAPVHLACRAGSGGAAGEASAVRHWTGVRAPRLPRPAPRPPPRGRQPPDLTDVDRNDLAHCGWVGAGRWAGGWGGVEPSTAWNDTWGWWGGGDQGQTGAGPARGAALARQPALRRPSAAAPCGARTPEAPRSWVPPLHPACVPIRASEVPGVQPTLRQGSPGARRRPGDRLPADALTCTGDTHSQHAGRR